ncbi:putative EamA domain-containing protein [Lupinus albus]|uniref:WAT1-related protein n=1 Tax=Lupinus albus TaxID=3870 RepID=A0A6A4NQQ5_LUPAL|nr:putative EamA domain-containing protein [Lupinus albus]
MENLRTQNWLERSKPFIAVVFLQFGFAGVDVLFKAAMNKGMSNYVLVVYRHAVAFIVITPFALILDKKVRPKMTMSIFMKIVALSLLEPVIDQNLYFLGMKYTTATFAAAMTNIIPAITFCMAYILGLEKIKIRSIRSQAKVIGTLVAVSGAMVMTLMKGPLLGALGTHIGDNHNHNQQHNNGTNIQHTIKGTIMIITGCFSWSCFVILQSITLDTYPAELSLTSWICLLGSLEGAVVAMIMERGNPSVWFVKWDIKLVAIIYSGIVGSGLAYYVQGVVMQTKGPVFVTAFSPLCMVIVAIMSSIILAEQLFLGRVIGAIIIVLGLYLVVWGKSKDYNNPSSPISKEPILPDKQIAMEGNVKMEHCNDEVITIGSSGVRIITQE